MEIFKRPEAWSDTDPAAKECKIQMSGSKKHIGNQNNICNR